jgi:hypothetical protein
MARQAYQLVRLGLQPATIARIAWQLGHERIQRHLTWKRVSLQPFMNFDFFASLYRRFQPDYATWHTNHVAHYMHHYWRAMDDTPFLTQATPEEKRHFGKAIPYGYVTIDQLLGKFMRLADEHTVIVLASSMGQQPYVSEEFPDGRITVRARDIHQLLRIVDARGVIAVAPAMAQQWNITIPDEIERGRVEQAFLRAYNTGQDARCFIAWKWGKFSVLARAALPNGSLASGCSSPGVRERTCLATRLTTSLPRMTPPQNRAYIIRKVSWCSGVRTCSVV